MSEIGGGNPVIKGAEKGTRLLKMHASTTISWRAGEVVWTAGKNQSSQKGNYLQGTSGESELKKGTCASPRKVWAGDEKNL